MAVLTASRRGDGAQPDEGKIRATAVANGVTCITTLAAAQAAVEECRAVRQSEWTVSALQDFFYVKVSGVSFIVLGSRQTGKTTLIEWLRHNMHTVDEFAPDPTAAGGDVVPDFNTRVGDQYMYLVMPMGDRE